MAFSHITLYEPWKKANQKRPINKNLQSNRFNIALNFGFDKFPLVLCMLFVIVEVKNRFFSSFLFRSCILNICLMRIFISVVPQFCIFFSIWNVSMAFIPSVYDSGWNVFFIPLQHIRRGNSGIELLQIQKNIYTLYFILVHYKTEIFDRWRWRKIMLLNQQKKNGYLVSLTWCASLLFTSISYKTDKP